MSLLECITELEVNPSASRRTDSDHLLRLQLRDELYQYLPAQRIAAMLAEDVQRAQSEVEAVLDKLLRSQVHQRLSAQRLMVLKQSVLDLVCGLGPLEGLLGDPTVTEIMVNGPQSVFFERTGRIYPSDSKFADEQQLRMVIDRIIGPLGRRVDEQCPMVSARLAQGHRVNVVIAPLALTGPVLTIRKFREQIFTLTELVAMGSIDTKGAQLLQWAVRGRRNIAVSGGTGTGKTTFLNALSVEISPSERVITIEDAAELRFSLHPHVVRLEARAANSEGHGEVSIRDLVVNALRMRPDRIVVGECRSGEALDMLQAMNTGHDGSMTTLHATSPAEVITRLVMMARYAMDLPIDIIEQQIGSALDLIVQLERMPDGSRRVVALCECLGSADGVRLDPLMVWDKAQQCYLWHQTPTWLERIRRDKIATSEEVDAWMRLAS